MDSSVRPVWLLATACLCLLGSDAKIGGIDPAVLEPGFCSEDVVSSDDISRSELNTNSMECARLMEFLYLSRRAIYEQLGTMRAQADNEGDEADWKSSLHRVSRASSFVSAHVHIITAISSQRAECFSEHVRLLLVVNLRRLKTVSTTQLRQLWIAGQDGPSAHLKLSQLARQWLKQTCEGFDADLKTMRTVLQVWLPPPPDEARFYSHEADGRYSTMEALRRDTFEEWRVDKGLLQGLLRHIFALDAAVVDFGAGSGHYAQWLNDTGLVTAWAFDGSPDIELVTKGAVLSVDLSRPFDLERQFDWSICIDVAEHVPIDFAPTLIRNLDKHSKIGIVLSWARPGLPGVVSTNPQSESEVLALMRQHSGFHFDQGLTAQLRSTTSAVTLAESVMVFVREPRALQGTCSAKDANGACVDGAGALPSIAGSCEAEEGLIYAGNDVQMHSDVPSAAACCNLCNENDNCRFWTWSREEGHKDLCWIKSTREYRINHQSFISGAKRAS